MDGFDETLAPVLDTVRKTRYLLASEGFDQTALIGFAGAPWTVACYMVEGGGSRDFNEAKRWAYHDPDRFSKLIELLTRATIRYLSAQISAGAEAVQLFDSWPGFWMKPCSVAGSLDRHRPLRKPCAWRILASP